MSGRFNYTSQPAVLWQFLWRYNHMGDVARGLDPTVSVPNTDKKAGFENAVAAFLKDLKERLPRARAHRRPGKDDQVDVPPA